MSPEPANSERRKYSRKSPPSLVYVELGPSNGGMMRNLSEKGFALRAMMPLRPGETTPFSFSLNPTVRIDGQAEILWTEEDGRVAGARFLDLPAAALALIRGWLNGTLVSPEKEEPPKPAAPEAQTFEELREELRAPTQSRPPAKPHWVLRPPAPSPEAPVPQTVTPEKTPGNAPTVNKETAKQAEPPPRETPHVPDASAFPGLPVFSSTEQTVEISFEPLPPPSRRGASRSVAPAEETIQEEIEAEETAAPPPAPGVPDISDILMPPPGHERSVPSRVDALGSMESSGLGRPSPPGWMEWFTLPRAVAIMALLGLAVGALAYHRTLGRALIWLGEEMEGTTVEQAPAPGALDTAGSTPSTPNAAQAGSVHANSVLPESNRNDAQTPAPPTAQSSPPVTPLSGIAPSAGSEAGLTEYSQAMRLLHENSGNLEMSEALRLLWISVEKGNPSAELTLAELYWHGKGVARNCDQTRILLNAAARKGNAEAQKDLRQIERDGCE